MNSLIRIALIAGLAWFAYERFVAVDVEDSAVTPAVSSAQYSPVASSPRFSCDGRTHCSQMRSCEEATFFLRNCPNTKMDGNNDGVPCERQWCR